MSNENADCPRQVAADSGSDVTFRPGGNSDFSTPNIDALAHAGVILQQFYVTVRNAQACTSSNTAAGCFQPLCSPSRAAFLTGRYPYNLGLAHGVITNGALFHAAIIDSLVGTQVILGTCI